MFARDTDKEISISLSVTGRVFEIGYFHCRERIIAIHTFIFFKAFTCQDDRQRYFHRRMLTISSCLPAAPGTRYEIQ